MSRYSEFKMYWLFGFLVPEIEVIEIDLLASPGNDTSPTATAVTLAISKFTDQLRKAMIDKDRVIDAKLVITRSSQALRKPVHYAFPPYTENRDGYDVTFAAEATMLDGVSFTVSRTAFVAPHDPTRERKSFGGIPPDAKASSH